VYDARDDVSGMAPKKRGRDESGEQQSGVAKEKKEVVRATITDAVVDAVNTSVEAAFQELEDERKSAEAERAQLLAEARATAATTTETAEDEDEEITRKVKEERARLLAEAAETAAKVKEDATAEAEEITRKAREGLAAFEAEKAAMEQAHTFQNNKILLNVGGHKFKTSRQTLTSVPDTYLASMFSGRFELAPDGAERSYFIDRDGTHFRHILNFLRDSGSFKLNSGLTEAQREELKVELEFYGLLDRVMPYCAQELIGQSLLKRACLAGTKLALQTAVDQTHALVFEMGSATPFLYEEFQDLLWVITDRVVNGSPVWATEDGDKLMYRGGAVHVEFS
jgi:hypothetical protein